MDKIKEFCKNHKKGIVLTGCLIAGVAIGITIAKGNFGKKKLLDSTGGSVISWIPGEEFMNLERVKEILDLNANNSSAFAILREGPDPDKYFGIALSDDVIGAFKEV